MSQKYSITCSAMDERDIALIKSLIGIVGKGNKDVPGLSACLLQPAAHSV